MSTNVDDYTINELMDIIGIDTLTEENVETACEEYIQQFQSSTNQDIATFFKDIETKLLEQIDIDNENVTNNTEIVNGAEGAKPAVPSTPKVTKKTGPDIFSMLAGAYKVADATKTMALAVGGGLVASEKPQSFNGTGSDTIECSFYLYNTQELADIRRNWEFCYLFTYQNLANRKGINLLDPPCLYRALIPGYKQLPICWISGLSIVNIGSTKLIDITTGNPVNSTTQAGPNIKMIPEAYKISFTLESALKNARNIFQYAADPSGVVSVSFSKEQP